MQEKKSKSLSACGYDINKTEQLEKGIAVFPSIYIEGNASIGKTMAVQMLLNQHPEYRHIWIDMKGYSSQLITLQEKLQEIERKMEDDVIWTVFENINQELSSEIAEIIASFCERLVGENRAILIGRERIQVTFLPLIWKRKMEHFTQNTLLFTKEDVIQFVEKADCKLNPTDVYVESGGWAGCVDLMVRQSVLEQQGSEKRVIRSAKELRESYEIDTYIRKEIVGVLSEQEQELVYWGQRCPWFTKELCLEVWKDDSMIDALQRLERKGIFIWERQKEYWRLSSLFRKRNDSVIEENEKSDIWKKMGLWYDKNGNIQEAIFCFKQSKDPKAYQTCMIAHYDIIPFLGIDYREVMEWKEQTLELCYLRGMYCYFQRDMNGLQKEIHNIEAQNGNELKKREILLNLFFVKLDVSLDQWLEMLEKNTEEVGKIRLYHILGYSYTFLCGLRDLSQAFACSKWEEKRKRQIWKNGLGDYEWKCYQMARIDYYIETERQNKLETEDLELLNTDMAEEKETWQIRLAQLYLLCKLQNGKIQLEQLEQIHALEKSLLAEEHMICRRNAEAIRSIYGLNIGKPERLVRWLRLCSQETKVEVTEATYVSLSCQAKGYMLLNQLEKAERILRQLIPYVQWYRRNRIWAELLFQQGIIIWQRDSHSQALKSLVETFLVTGDSHYVGFYTEYGKNGIEALNGYIEWLRNTEPEKWKRKKKYNYGNVVRMPVQDYMEVVLHCAEKNNDKFSKIVDNGASERLTLMEISVLRSIQQGKSNAEICQELNLKLSTVKSHIYNLYKKLEVNSRMQAVKKGKELGIIE